MSLITGNDRKPSQPACPGCFRSFQRKICRRQILLIVPPDVSKPVGVVAGIQPDQEAIGRPFSPAGWRLAPPPLLCPLTSLSLFFRRKFLAFVGTRLLAINPKQTTLLTVMTGAVLGLLVTISSVGAGALGVTALLLLYPRLPMAIIVGSDIAHAVPLTLAAGIGHWVLGSVDWPLLLLC